MKKIYFACSIRGGRDDQLIYAEIVSKVKAHAEVLSELFGDQNLTASGHTDLSDAKIWQRDINWLTEADGVIAEVTNPSLGVGYELAKAEEMGKPVLALFRANAERKLSAMIAGSAKIKVVTYQAPSELESVIKEFIKTL